MDTRERFAQLIDLASGGALEERRKLALELADVLLLWPTDYPAHMRDLFALLLGKLLAQLGGNTRQELAARFAAEPTAPMSPLIELFIDASCEARKAILARVEQETPTAEPALPPVDETALIDAVRKQPREAFVQVVSRLLEIPASIADRVVVDSSGECLAMLCKGAHLSRVTFSTIAMLTEASLSSAERKLESYESVSPDVSQRLVQLWRSRSAPSSTSHTQAA